MKRVGRLYQRIWLYDNLLLAAYKAGKGKRSRLDVINFYRYFDINIEKIGQGLRHHRPDIGHYRFFRIRDPKPRHICAAPFPERVLHHAIMNVCQPVLESFAIFDSYACRKGKGTSKALARAKQFVRKYPWYLKLDIRKYFDSIDHEILLAALARRFKDHELLRLFAKLVDTYHTEPGKGLPIGNLFSQHGANFYLGLFDHWLKEERRVKGYLRYMDDMVLFGPRKSHLTKELAAVQHFLARRLKLELKPNIQLNRSRHGLPFLGYRIFPHTIRLSSSSKRRFINKFIEYEHKWHEGIWSDEQLVRHMEPLIAFTMVADAKGLRTEVIERYGVPY